MLLALAILAIAGGTTPAEGDTRFDAVGRLNNYCSAVLVRPGVVLTARHCVLPDQPHAVSWRTGAVSSVAGFYLPEGGDAALGYLADPPAGIEPIPMAFSGAEAGQAIALVGAGHSAELASCSSYVTWSAPESYIGFPAADEPTGPGCGTESGDSGGGVIVGGRARRVLGVLVGLRDATNLARYAADVVFNPPPLKTDRVAR